jgi:hypothetical protein
MSGILWAVLGMAIGLLTPVLFLLWRRGVAETAGSPPAPRRTPASVPNRTQAQAPGGLKRRLARKFHGVSLKPGPHACAAVQALAGQRFLSDEAPPLPLSACDQQKCQCAYSHHANRRDQEDRRSGWGGFGGFTPTLPEGNRRAKKRERRSRA